MSPQITAHSRRSGNVFPLCLGTALRLIFDCSAYCPAHRHPQERGGLTAAARYVRPFALLACPVQIFSRGALFLVRPIFQRRLPAYSVQGRCRVIRVGCYLVAARLYFAEGLAAPCIRGCGPDRRGLAGCAALPIESLVTPMLVLLAAATCSGRCACVLRCAGLLKNIAARCSVLR